MHFPVVVIGCPFLPQDIVGFVTLLDMSDCLGSWLRCSDTKQTGWGNLLVGPDVEGFDSVVAWSLQGCVEVVVCCCMQLPEIAHLEFARRAELERFHAPLFLVSCDPPSEERIEGGS